jgi:hypothetical protein
MRILRIGFSLTLSAVPALALSACIGEQVALQNLPSTSDSGSGSTSSVSVPSGPRAARIIFKNTFPSGSFDAAPASGTTVTPGSGHRATRVFNADGSLLAQGGPTASAWPAWLQGVEIGISGGDNSGAPSSTCARFATAAESAVQCDFNPNGTVADTVSCGAAAGLYRVSEFDCVTGSTSTGNGGPNDGVYVRAYFSRDPSRLASHENILAVLEYSAAGLRQSSSNPSACFSGGVFNPAQAGCSDFVWNVYLKHNAYEVVQPYLMLIPPTVGVADFNQHTAPTGVSTRQFVIPLAADSGINTVQISRVWAMPLTTEVAENSQTFSSTCRSNSAHCLGVVLHTLTFFRM